jgi:hypothetical protein
MFQFAGILPARLADSERTPVAFVPKRLRQTGASAACPGNNTVVMFPGSIDRKCSEQ